jgi:tetratricopeptide (TPR) repeat protein
MTKELIIPKKLEEAINKNNLVFFIGAGCSIPLNFPSWKDLIESILEELVLQYGSTSDVNFQNILNGIKSDTKTLFDALNLIERDAKHGSDYKTKSKEIVNAQIESISKELPAHSDVHSLLWNISTKIITTNYDKALEFYKPSNINPKIFDNTNTFQSLKSQSDDAQFLYKIHGDNDNPDSVILFESDYENIYKSGNHNHDALATFFKDKTILFIGFSLKDPFVNDLFTNIKKIYNGYTVNQHFVFTINNEDFIKYDVATIPIDNWNESLLGYLSELQKIKSISSTANNKLSVVIEEKKDEELTNNDVSSIVKLIELKTKELSSNPGNKELHKEVNDLRAKINKLMFGEIDYSQKVDKPFRNADLQALFDVIYSSEKLDGLTLERIQKVRTEADIYKWYDRSVIVSAITCSLIHFNKADEQKITLLIDFINDNEEKVWQKAMTSLFMVLNHLGSKWLKFTSIKNKIKSLNQNLRVQNSCSVIIQLFFVGLNNVSMVNEDLFVNPYFSKNPFNYFLPYHQEENPAFELVYDTYKEGDIEEFIDALDKTPIPDQLKYLFCSRTRENDDNDQDNKKMSSALKKILNLNSIFYPYSIHVQEIISFYKFFPIYKHKEKLTSQLKLTETPLKDYLLNSKQKYKALGSHFMQEKNWSQAIVNYKKFIELDENNILVLLNLANCYHNNKEKSEEFSLRTTVQNIEPKNENNLRGFFDLYFHEKKDYINSLDIANQLLAINDNNSDYFYYRGISCNKLKNYENAIFDFNKAIDINLKVKSDHYYYGRAGVFYEQKEYAKANNDLDIAISINKEDYQYLLEKATNNMYLSLFDNALSDIEKARSLGSNKDSLYHVYSNYYRLTNDFPKAFEYIEKAEKLKADFRFTGTKATIYASMGEDDNFYKYLEKAFEEGADADLLFPDIKDKYKSEPKFIALLEKYKQEIF